MWSDLAGDIWYTYTSDEDEGVFYPRKPLRVADLRVKGLPAMAVLDGYLHAIITLDTEYIIHYLFDDDTLSWVEVGVVSDDQRWPRSFPESRPSIVAFQGKLFTTYVDHGMVYYTIWDASSHDFRVKLYHYSTWPTPQVVDPYRQALVQGTPSLVVIERTLYILFEAKGGAETPVRVLGYAWNSCNSTWQEVSDIPKAFGTARVSATSYGDTTYVGLIQSTPSDNSQSVYLSTLQKHAASNLAPHRREPVANQTASDPPQLAILNGRIHCIFNDNTPSKNLKWYSRPILPYSLSSWMSSVPSPTLLSQLTIPGTHDSCARSNIPYVRTQYLSITQQLALGIRFLDLRLRRHDDNRLYLYHGGVPLGLPGRLSFQAVMDEVWTFLQLQPSETVLVSIDNDDHSDSQKLSPGIFYRAVEFAILTTPYYADGSPRWFTDFSTTPYPTLGQVRGRAVLLRRYLPEPGISPLLCQGLDLSAWVNDSPEFTIVTPTGTRVHIQDKWHFTERIALQDLIAAKSGFVQNLMGRATGKPPSLPPSTKLGAEDDDQDGEDGDNIQDWYINFCSAVGDPTAGGDVAQAKWIAVGARSSWVGGRWIEGMNIITREFVQARREEEELLRDEDDNDNDDDNGDDDNDNDDIGNENHGTNKGLLLSTRRSTINDSGMGKRKANRNRRWYRLGIVNLDYPELPVENDIVARLIDVNFLNF
ncbi:phosphatidylinositol-specific phospholipase [Naviculisporaceae sp. PSN 640]